jgi:hypothetical protein
VLKKTNIINTKSFLILFLLLISLISLYNYLSSTSSPQTFAQSTTGKTSMENSQSKDKLSTNTPSPNSDITSNISLILTPAPDIINPTDNEDFQVPEENLKADTGDDKTTGAGTAGNSHSEGKSLITPSSSNKKIKTNNGSNTAETIKPTVITPANSKKTATSGSSGEPATANSYSKGKSLITASSGSGSGSGSSSNQSKTNNGSNTAETTKPTVITPANSKNTSTAAIKDTGKQNIIGTGNSTNTGNKTTSPNTYPNGKPPAGNATNNDTAATTANITSNITASSSGSGSSGNQSKTNNGANTAETTKPTVITPANSKNTSTAAIKDTGKQNIIGTDNKTINDKSLKGNNKSSPQEINANNSISKSSNMTPNKTGQQGSSAFPWLDQISKILGVK